MAKNHGKQNFRWLTFPAQPFSIFPAFTCMNKFRLHVLYVRPAPLCPPPFLLIPSLSVLSFVYIVPCQIHIIIHSYMIRQRNRTREKTRKPCPGFVLHREWKFSSGLLPRVGFEKMGNGKIFEPRQKPEPTESDRRGIGKWKLMNEIWYNVRFGFPQASRVFSALFGFLL